MEVTGKIVFVGQVVTGQGKSKPWAKQEFVIETPGQYPKKIALTLWGEDLINKYDLEIGLTVTAKIDIESREHNERWYTELKAYKVSWDPQARSWQP